MVKIDRVWLLEVDFYDLVLREYLSFFPFSNFVCDSNHKDRCTSLRKSKLSLLSATRFFALPILGTGILAFLILCFRFPPCVGDLS